MNTIYLVKETLTDGYLSNNLNIISLLAIFCGVLIIINKNPVVSVLFLIGLFGNISVYLIFIGLTFMGLAYLVVYVGAILKRNLNINVALVKIQLYRVLLIIIQIFQKEIVYTFYFRSCMVCMVSTDIIKISGNQIGAPLSCVKLYNNLINQTVNLY